MIERFSYVLICKYFALHFRGTLSAGSAQASAPLLCRSLRGLEARAIPAGVRLFRYEQHHFVAINVKCRIKYNLVYYIDLHAKSLFTIV